MYKILHIPTARLVYDSKYVTRNGYTPSNDEIVETSLKESNHIHVLYPVVVESKECLRSFLSKYRTVYFSANMCGITFLIYTKLGGFPVIKEEHFELIEV